MAHLRRRLGAVDEAAAALAEGAEPVDEENRQVELQRLRLRLFGGSVDACLAPSWASAQPAAAASAAAASSAQLGAPQVDAHASPPQPPLLPPLPSSALASVFATPPQQLAATAQPALASSLALQDTRALPPPLLSSPLLPVPLLPASQEAMPLASTALTSSVLAHAAADAALLFASGASSALLDAPALHAEPAGGGGPRWQRGSLRPSDYATPIETQEERILFMRVLGSKAAPRDTDGWHRFAEHYNAAVAAETERLPRGADPVVRPKTADQLQVYANKLKDDLQQGNAAAPNAAAAAENAALRERVLASGRGTPQAGAQPPPAVTAQHHRRCRNTNADVAAAGAGCCAAGRPQRGALQGLLRVAIDTAPSQARGLPKPAAHQGRLPNCRSAARRPRVDVR